MYCDRFASHYFNTASTIIRTLPCTSPSTPILIRAICTSSRSRTNVKKHHLYTTNTYTNHITGRTASNQRNDTPFASVELYRPFATSTLYRVPLSANMSSTVQSALSVAGQRTSGAPVRTQNGKWRACVLCGPEQSGRAALWACVHKRVTRAHSHMI